MINSFFSITNQSGIACVSNTDGTLHQISRKEPLAVAVCPLSPIPWDRIVTDYKSKGEPIKRQSIEEYAKDFEEFLQDYQADVAWNKLDQDQLNIIFLGYGAESTYPTVCDVAFNVDSNTNRLKFSEYSTKQISVDFPATFNWNGNFNRLMPIFFGRNEEVQSHMKKNLLEMFEIYKQEVIGKFENTKYEAYVRDSLDKYDRERILSLLISASDRVNREVCLGMETFSIEEMVESCEKIVVANTRLNLLLNNNSVNIPSGPREIAVLTRTEGFTWIKHSLYAI